MTYQIIKGKQKLRYDDQNIIKKYRGTEIKRKNLIIQIIELNPKIPHTHLIEMLLYFGEASAKRTYENLLNKLEKEGILVSEKTGMTSNSPRLWEISTKETTDERQIKTQLNISMEKSKKRLEELEQMLPKLTDYQKALMFCMLLKSNNENLMSAKVANKIGNMSKQLDHLTKYENTLHELMLKYPNCLKFIPNILNSFQLETLKMLLQLMNEYQNKSIN